MPDPCPLSQVEAVGIDGKRTLLHLTTRLGGGGEGIVCEGKSASGQRYAVKVFHEDKRHSKLPKVRAMLKTDPESGAKKRHIAWPLALAESQGVAVGYTMDIVEGLELIHATEPQYRWELAHFLDLFSLHWLAENLASAVEKLHALGHVCGDFKDQNTLFNAKSLVVSLIDTDSFGIASATGFPPDAYTEDWSPPEFLRSQTRSRGDIGKAHDLFSLAVLFHHLFFGVHPFSGEVVGSDDADLSIVDAIQQGRWLYRNGPAPNPHSTPLTVVAPSLQELFRRAFINGHQDPHTRPSAKEWRETFRAARWRLRWCERHPLHVFDGSAGTCPWCVHQTELWGNPNKVRSLTRGNALKELEGLALVGEGSIEAFDHAKARLAANPGFASKVPALTRRINQIEGALDALSAAGDDDLALMEAADKIWRDPDLVRFAKHQGHSGLIDKAQGIKATLQRLDALVANAKPEDGRYLLAREQELVSQLDREIRRAPVGPEILFQYRPRIDAAKTRIQAVDALEDALAGRAHAQVPPISHLEATLTDLSPQFKTIADKAVADRVAVAHAIVSLHAELTVPSQDESDDAIVAFWERHIAPIPSLGIVDISLAPGQRSIRQRVQQARESAAAIAKLTALLQRPVSDFPNHAVRDHALIAADPVRQLSERGRQAFEASPANAQLKTARERLQATEQLERLAAFADRDRNDPALVLLWGKTVDRDKLVLSARARERIALAEDRLARLDQIRPLAEQRPPDDEALLAALADGADDLMGLALQTGETLRERVDLAKRRIATRDKLVLLMARVDSQPQDVAAEAEIARAWDDAEAARQQAPALFHALTDRAALSHRRIRFLADLQGALAERYGGGAQALWHRRVATVGEFAPIMALADEVQALLGHYQDMMSLVEQAEHGRDEDELLALADRSQQPLDLKDAALSRPELQGRSLRGHLDRLRISRWLQKHRDGLDGLALDPTGLRWYVAQLFPTGQDAIDATDLGDSVVDDVWRDALRANGYARALRDSVTAAGPDADNFRDFLRLWDEAWHPLLPSTAELVEPARRLAARALANAVVRNVRLEPADEGRLRLRWDWPFTSRREDGAANGSCQMMAIAIGPRHASDPLRDAQSLVHCFRHDGEEDGAVDIVETADRLDAVLITGCVIGDEPVYSRQKVSVRGKPRVLAYRFERAGWIWGSDALVLTCERPMRSPPLKVVHQRTGKILAQIGPQQVGPHAVRIDLLSSISRHPGLRRDAYRRWMGSTSFSYRVELAEQADDLSVKLAHPRKPKDQQLSVAWR